MPKSDLFASLNDVVFADKNPQDIESEIITQYETLSGRSLAKGDPVRIFLDAVILAIIQQRNLIDIAAKSNLLAYATGDALDHLGALLGVTRLNASHAACTAKFTLSQVQPFTVIIPAGTRITPGDNILFTVSDSAEIKPGISSIEVSVICDTPGETGNGYVPGQINKIVDVFAYEMNVVNISVSSGGSDVENDENFRERIMLAPESFTTAGSVEAYRYYARSAHPDISDVAILTPPVTDPGHVHIYPLLTGGVIPDDNVLKSVLNVCSSDNIRPDTDYVQVLKPEAVLYDININYWLNSDDAGNAGSISQNVDKAVQDFIAWQKSVLGRDVNPSELMKYVMNAGAKRCEIISPAFRVIYPSELAVCNNFSVNFRGLEEA